MEVFGGRSFPAARDGTGREKGGVGQGARWLDRGSSGRGLDAERRAVAVHAEFLQHDGLAQLLRQVDMGIQVVAAEGDGVVPGGGRALRIEAVGEVTEEGGCIDGERAGS